MIQYAISVALIIISVYTMIHSTKGLRNDKEIQTRYKKYKKGDN